MPGHLDFLSHIPADRIRHFESVGEWERDRQSRRSARAGEIGGSLLGQILGVSSYGGPWAAFLTATGNAPPRDDAEQALLNEGSRWESVVLDEYARTSAAERVWSPAPGILQIVGRESWHVATIDGATFDRELGCGVLELKTDRDPERWGHEPLLVESWSQGLEKVIPPEYALQTYWYMAAAELPYADLCAMLPVPWGFPRIITHRLMRDLAVEAELLERVGEWRHRHLVLEEPPDIDASAQCRGFVRAAHPAREKKVVRPATEIEANMIAEWRFAKSRVDEAKTAVDFLTNQLMSAIGSDYGIRVAAGRVLSIEMPGRRHVDIDKLVSAHPATAGLVTVGEGHRQLRGFFK